MNTLRSIALAACAWLVTTPAGAQAPPAPAHRIDGVAYVGWNEAAGWDYPGRDVTNPAIVATLQMQYGYWGRDLVAEMMAKAKEDARFQDVAAENKSLADLKAAIDRGLPAYARLATTSNAHRLYLVPKMCAAFKDIKLDGPERASGSLGEMIPVAHIQKLRDADCGVGLDDSVISRPRLVIGYDDARQVLTVHDPSLGPDLELGYDDFDRAWAAMGRFFSVLEPRDPAARPTPAVLASRARTADDDAAVALFEGYALEVTGDPAAATEMLRRGLAIPGISGGREHLLRLELGTALFSSGRTQEAVAEIRRANETFGEYWLSHWTLARILGAGLASERREAKAEERAAKKLCSQEAYRHVAAVLGRDFPIMGCGGEMLGWLRP